MVASGVTSAGRHIDRRDRLSSVPAWVRDDDATVVGRPHVRQPHSIKHASSRHERTRHRAVDRGQQDLRRLYHGLLRSQSEGLKLAVAVATATSMDPSPEKMVFA